MVSVVDLSAVAVRYVAPQMFLLDSSVFENVSL